MHRSWSVVERLVSVTCVAVMLFVVAQSAAASVGQLRHQLGLAHSADPLAGALLQNHLPDHDHAPAARDPHSDWDGPPIVQDKIQAAPHHHHHNEGQTAVWILPTLAVTSPPAPIVATWLGLSSRLVGVSIDQGDPPPKTPFAQTA